MSLEKSCKFHMPDLKPKVRTLEAIFGEKFMRAGLNPRTVDKWLRDSEPTPYLKSLKKYFGVIGMKESDMIACREEFSKRAARAYSHIKGEEPVRYGEEDVAAIYDRFTEGHRQGGALLAQTLKTMQKETIRNDYLYLKGDYHAYHYWDRNMKEASKIHRFLVRIYDLDETPGLMNCQIITSPGNDMKKDARWIYEGWMFNTKNKLFFLFECVKGMLPEIVTFHVFKPSFWPDTERFLLHGILSALSLDGIPSASTLLLKKIRPEEELKDAIGYFSTEDIKAEGRHADILDHIGPDILKSLPG